MNITELIQHPETMNRETLYDLRNLTALYPYYQTVRLLLLQNLYVLHDPAFDEELRRAAIYISDRKVLFNLFEAAHYKLHSAMQEEKGKGASLSENRTTELIDSFLESIPDEDAGSEDGIKEHRRPTAADATVDYVAYLMRCDDSEEPAPQMKGQTLIDDFLGRDGGRIVLPEISEETSKAESGVTAEPVAEEDAKNAEEGVYTETLARIYVRQGRYSQALEIIKRLNLDNPKKNSYFADQIRFLEKLVANKNVKNK